jgi:hypothetical protein
MAALQAGKLQEMMALGHAQPDNTGVGEACGESLSYFFKNLGVGDDDSQVDVDR